MEAGSSKKLAGILHGTLEITISDATPTPSPSPCGCLSPREKPAYVTVELGQTTVAETTREHDRRWNQTFVILCAHPADAVLVVTLRTSPSSALARTSIPASRLLEDDPGGGGGGEGPTTSCLVDGSSFPLLTEKGRRPSPKLKLRFVLRFERAELEPRWGSGLGGGGFGGLVDGVFFRQRSDCDVTLYQDAHHHRSFLPPVQLGGGGGGEEVRVRPRRLWEDVYRAIDGAKHLVYIAGWAFNPNLVLVRDPESELEHAVGVKLGDLLKAKAEQGVAVRVMLWDDETSLHLLHGDGLMHTHDEQTAAFFRHTAVDCRLCPRHHHLLPSFFTHHQKTISVDAPAGLFSNSGGSSHHHELYGPSSDGGGLREIISFVGGLDLYDGRYDTEEHSLFRTLDAGGAHALDFYQTSIPGADLHHGGPREPWHDTHARVAGAAAYDVLANFEQRWSKQCDPSSLLPIRAIPDILPAESALAGAGEDGWNVQVFRSIDGHSTDHLPAGDLPFESSVHEAYVGAIRRAERFIYIENQYFFGGCQHWERDRSCGCANLIPVEIALKVASKVRAGERFAAYIVMPMWPEGSPDGEAVQDMLHWARLTVAMMYRLVGEAIRESGGGGGAHPRDYLSFFCLANREEKRGGDELAPAAAPPRGTQYWKAQQNRRFMIYVHSKLMIVDDEYLLIGSANVNQRSMDGRRDTEIAVGCHQPSYVGERRAAGDVHAYRMSLWYEHTGGAVVEAFREPQGVDCARQLNAMADAAWGVYSGEAVADMGGVHLVSYPVAVSADGAVGDLEQGGGVFPDTGAAVKGRSSWVLPTVMTT